MPASYPSSVKSFTAKADSVDIVQAAHINDIQDEVTAIEQGLVNGFQHIVKPLTNDTTDLGTTTLRWRNLWLSGELTGVTGVFAGTVSLTNTVNSTARTFQVGNNGSGTAGYIQAYGTAYASSGAAVADGATFGCDTAGGMSISAAHASGEIRFFTGGSSKRASVSSAGHWLFGNGFHLNVGVATYPGRTTTNPTNAINIYEGTAPAGTLADGLTIYAKDVAGVTKLFYMDSAGTEVGPLT